MHSKPDYQQTLRDAALCWMHRHSGAYLADDQLLFAKAVEHLVQTHGCKRESAENATVHAYGEFRGAGTQMYLDTSLSTGRVAVIRDPASGIHYSVPVSAILTRIINSPDRRRLRAVN